MLALYAISTDMSSFKARLGPLTDFTIIITIKEINKQKIINK